MDYLPNNIEDGYEYAVTIVRKKCLGCLQWLVEGKELTSRQCKAEFGVIRAVTAIDFGKLVEMGLAENWELDALPDTA